MKIYTDIDEARRTILRRKSFDEVVVSPAVQERLDSQFGAGTTPAEAVARILTAVRTGGDSALRRYSQAFDGFAPEGFEVTAEEIAAAYALVGPAVLEAMRAAAEEIRRFHRRGARQSWVEFGDEGALGQLVLPLERVGLYAPGGSAPLPSSLLMAAIPAREAGVKEVICCSPPQRESGQVHPLVRVAADIAGVDRLFRIGGAQAIAAMAYGTESVPRVDKIVGPGNLFVVLAKRAVFGAVDIEALPGPTETMIIADGDANPLWCAADLLAQAEHDELASAILVTPSAAFAAAVQCEVERQAATLERGEIARRSLAAQGGIVLVEDLDAALELANGYGPEHLCLSVSDPWQVVGKVRNAGGLFVGERSFEVLGDYVAGPSHIMPTGGTARFASPLNVDDFRKVISLVGLNEAGLRRLAPVAITLATAEGLTGHAAAVRARTDGGDA